MTWQDIEFFTPDEFACRCGCGQNEIDPEFVQWLDSIRRRLGWPFVVTSGYRCPEHPIEAKKAQPGAHATGVAADIHCFGEKAHELIELALVEGVRGLGVNQRGDIDGRFIHLDLSDDGKRPRPWVWSY